MLYWQDGWHGRPVALGRPNHAQPKAGKEKEIYEFKHNFIMFRFYKL
jgi:hypothetical protein